MIKNLTPHALGVYDASGREVARIEPSGLVPRVKTQASPAGEVEIAGMKVLVVETSYGQVEGLPAPEDGTVFVASILVIQALKSQGLDRRDVVAPDTGPQSVVRDPAGNILGVKRFTR